MTVREAMLNLEDLKLPENGQEGTSDPIFIVYNRDVELSERMFSELEQDDRIEYIAEAAEWVFVGTYDKDIGEYEIVPDKWFVDEGYAIWQQRFYGVFLTRKEAEEAIKQRHYALNNPYVYCESMYRSSDTLKQLIRLYLKATEPGVMISKNYKKDIK